VEPYQKLEVAELMLSDTFAKVDLWADTEYSRHLEIDGLMEVEVVVFADTESLLHPENGPACFVRTGEPATLVGAEG